MNDNTPSQAEVLAAMIVLNAYQAGDMPAEDYEAVERARAVISAYLPSAVELLCDPG